MLSALSSRPLYTFYPRPPRGGRPEDAHGNYITEQISIHALREEGDGSVPGRGAHYGQFLSTPSARRATGIMHETAAEQKISIHALREEGDSKNRDKISIFKQIIQHSARI